MATTPSNVAPAFDSAVIMGGLASVAVVLRFVAKSSTKNGRTADDVFIVLALLAYWADVSVQSWGTFAGGGGLGLPNLLSHNPESIALYTEAQTIIPGLLALAITFVKISILCLYYRLFSTRIFKRIIIALGTYAVLWCVASETVVALTCMPLDPKLDSIGQGWCINTRTAFLWLTMVDLVNEVAIFCLPVWIIHKLQLRLREKVGLMIIFLLGGLVLVAVVMHIILTADTSNGQVSPTARVLWGNIHIGVAIICACFPVYRPLLALCIEFSQRTGILPSAKRSEAKSSSTRSKYTTAQQYGGSLGSRTDEPLQLVKVIGGASGSVPTYKRDKDDPSGSIGVQVTVEQVTAEMV
ncbi:hypothetical protein MMC13_006745 [Lambiella insularis]|nr:hypothetical protein [Lambiella insularis]